MNERDLKEELGLEELLALRSMRRAWVRSHNLSLVERSVVLAVTAAGAIFALIHSIG
jgi:hypothetical protein